MKNEVKSGHRFGGNKAKGYDNPTMTGNEYTSEGLFGAIKRAVLTISPSRNHEEHYATFPKELAEIPIKACVPREICTKCDIPQFDIYHIERARIKRKNPQQSLFGKSADETLDVIKVKEKGKSNCNCNAGYTKGLVCDPFGGLGTVGIAAKELGLDFSLIDINREYCDIPRKNLNIY